jgi:uncharacterized protein
MLSYLLVMMIVAGGLMLLRARLAHRADEAVERAHNVTRDAVLAERVETARGAWARMRGLAGRRELPAGNAMWLPATSGVHMLLMRFPIDVAFLARPAADGTREITDVRHALRPWRGVVWWSRGAAGALELPAGTLAATGTRVGDRLSLRAPGAAGR